MNKNAKIYIAGHRGLVGSALIRQLQTQGYSNIVTRTHAELDLTNQTLVAEFFATEQPEYVILAAAKVGGIHANNTYPAEFIQENLAIQSNVIHQSYVAGVKRLLFLGSSCIYPRDCPQPIKEEYLLTGPLEPTNRPYALAKIAGIEMCWSYNRQYGTQFLAMMPTNLYGPGDNYHPENSHVIPAMIRKLHTAKVNQQSSVTLWGTGTPKREFLYSDDMAQACVFILNLPDEIYKPLLGADRNDGLPPLLNLGSGSDLTIAELAQLVGKVVGFDDNIIFDTTKPDGTMKKLMDSSRLNQLGWHVTTSLRDGLQSAYQDFKKYEVLK
ncbi:MAG: GDP-L-fucose synthase [Methylotenera sp.]|uniref:GDP-L-fucose synthase family protein n=1 Tax=Methylotenera sp. TaxID=2051956 RepID=UPI002728BC23|nr:GDP-L-fucose synthase [Methylotenera sp.]MDO9206079.1 GDP-L-fucose synthase [Methylotenera sp.]MDP2402204.1 GDP-L-fucose synthase [Methylotenera sp.]MDP3094273.1 GDP-L-fucose synthase [Methylotenera sp.]MDZ4223964.1 GDP-L-fucose synthase [Methylotenera sp.]